jgi:stage II sporulation protein M
MIDDGFAIHRRDMARLRPFALASVSLFCVAALAGGLAIIYVPQLATQLQELLNQFAQMFRGLPKLQLAVAIFLNNSLKTLVVILLGPLLGIAPVIFLVMNGAILGAVMPVAAASRGVWPSIMTIFPHGVIELPAVFLGTSIGLRLGAHAWRRLKGQADRSLISEFGDGLRIYFTIIIPLLAVAAAIEVYVTPMVVGLVQ